MKSHGRHILIDLALVCVFVVAWGDAAHAYVDPGVGSFFWQMALAVVFGGLFYVRRFFSSIKSRLRKNGKQN